MKASGSYGELRVGYQRAARLTNWQIIPADGYPRRFGFVFTATVAEEHAYWVTQEPLDLALWLGNAEWLWRGIVPRRDGVRLTVSLAERPIVSERAPVSQAEGDVRWRRASGS